MRVYYPASVRNIHGTTLWRLAVRARIRRLVHQVRHPANAIATLLTGAIAVGGIVQGARIAANTQVPEAWVFGLAAAGAVWLGTRRWLRHLSERPEESPWVALGGDPRASAWRARAFFIATSLIMTAWAMGVTGGRAAAPLAAAWWTAQVAVWAVLCAAATRLRGPLRSGAERLTTPRASGAAIERRGRRRHDPSVAGARLTLRTLGANFAQGLALIGIAAFAIIPGVYRLQGPGPAGAFAAVILVVLLLGFATALRARVGPQHALLLLHERQVRAGLWRSLVAGQTAVIVLAAAAGYALLAAGTPGWRGSPGTWILGGMVLEWAVYLAIAAHLYASRRENDDRARLLLLQATGIALLGAVLVKGVAVGLLMSTWLIVPAGAVCAVLAVWASGRPPFSLRMRDEAEEAR